MKAMKKNTKNTDTVNADRADNMVKADLGTPKGAVKESDSSKALKALDSIEMPDLRDTYADVLPATAELPERKLTWMKLDLVTRRFKLDGTGMNNRIRSEVEANADDLEPKIRSLGLFNPPLMNVGSPYSVSLPERLRGDGRATVLARIRENSPETFERIFPEGLVPVYVCSVDRANAARISADHSDQRGLGHPFEISKTCWALLNAGHSIGDVIVLQKAPLAKFSTRISGGNSKLWESAKADRKRAKAASTKAERDEMLELAKKAEHGALYGNVQDRDRERRTPLVPEILTFYAENIRPESGLLSDPGQYIPKLTMLRVKRLLAAHEADVAAKPSVTRASPGAAFFKAFAEICKADQEAEKGEKVKSSAGKSKAAKDIKIQADQADQAKGIKAALLWAANIDSAENLTIMNQASADLSVVEYARLHLPNELATLMAAVAKHRADGQVAAMKAALAAAAVV
jgi:hypothetical protein